MPELIAVMVVLGLVAAAAIPALSGAASGRAAHGARLVVRDLTQARERAVATGVPTWVVFDPAAETCTVLAEDISNPGRAGALPLTDPATGRAFARTFNTGEFGGVGIESAAFDGMPEIGFDWLGRPLAGTGGPLAAQGVVILTGNHRITVETGGGLAAYSAP